MSQCLQGFSQNKLELPLTHSLEGFTPLKSALCMCPHHVCPITDAEPTCGFIIQTGHQGLVATVSVWVIGLSDHRLITTSHTLKTVTRPMMWWMESPESFVTHKSKLLLWPLPNSEPPDFIFPSLKITWPQTYCDLSNTRTITCGTVKR